MKRTTTTVIVSILALAGGGLAHRPNHHQAPQVMHVRTVGAWLCEGTLILGYDLETYDPATRSWGFRQDDGKVEVQVERGTWTTLPSVSGGEGRRRVNPTDVVALERVRAIRADATRIAASPRLVSAGCPG